MSIQELKREADALSDAERRELIYYPLASKHARGADSPSPPDRTAEFLTWARRPRPRIGLRETGTRCYLVPALRQLDPSQANS